MCFGMRGVVLCKSHDVEGVQDVGGVLRREQNGIEVTARRRDIYTRVVAIS